MISLSFGQISHVLIAPMVPLLKGIFVCRAVDENLLSFLFLLVSIEKKKIQS